MIGQTISHYKILEKLGEGGMGVVYKAQDTKLKRTVALKFLPPELTLDKDARERFFVEARASAALDHQNICNIFEIDEAEDQIFIAMGYVEGQNLKDEIASGPMPLIRAIDIATQIAEGLQEAHDKGIVHRDIKSANIMITEKGQVKIMDFGLAQLKGQSKLTKMETTAGTTSYMSPEQSLGKMVDHRTDIWSLGVVLYEMITGQLPFKGVYAQAVIYSILNEVPEPITAIRTGVPQELERIIIKALIKKPADRYQHADELMVDLRKLKKDLQPEVSAASKKAIQVKMLNKAPLVLIMGAVFLSAIIISAYFILSGPSTRIPREEIVVPSNWVNSIAVLPFRDFSPKKDQEYFCDGMTDAIIGKLSQLNQLKIISLTSVLQYKHQVRNLKKIGKELDVKTILEGSIQKEGKRIRVNTQLIQVSDDSHIWQKTYDRELKSLFSIQDEIGESIASSLRIELLQEEKDLLSQHHTQNIDAYKLYMQGRFFWRKRSFEALKKSIDYYENALKLDADYALAYSGLADTYSNMAWMQYVPQKEGFAKAKMAALKALELNDRLAEAHNSMAYILLDYEWKFKSAKQEFEKALQLNPGYANAYLWYSRYYVYHRDLDKAISFLNHALELDPLSPNIHYFLGYVYFWNNQDEHALAIIRKGLDKHPDFLQFYELLGYVYCKQSMFNDALEAFEKYSRPSNQLMEYYKLIIELNKGNTSGLEVFIKKLEKCGELDSWSPTKIADLYGLADQKEKSIEWLKKAVNRRDPLILYLKIISKPNDLNHPQIKELLRRIGLNK